MWSNKGTRGAGKREFRDDLGQRNSMKRMSDVLMSFALTSAHKHQSIGLGPNVLTSETITVVLILKLFSDFSSKFHLFDGWMDRHCICSFHTCNVQI